MDFLTHERPAVLHGTKVAIATMELIDTYKTMIQEQSTVPRELEEWANQLPTRQKMESVFNSLQAPIRPEEIGISPLLLASSKREAYRLRERHTLLKQLSLQTTHFETEERSL